MIKLGNNYYNLQIWDTAGQEVYQSITKSYYKKSDGLIVLYDVTEESTFLKVEKWVKEIENNSNKDTIVYLIGNKIDCIDHRIVEREKAEKVSKSIDKKYFEISAKLGINLKEIVFSLVKDILKRKVFHTIDPIHIVGPDSDGFRDTPGSSCCVSDNKKTRRKR